MGPSRSESSASKPTSVQLPYPPNMTDETLATAVLDGIGGHQQSFARWALSELERRLQLARDPESWDQFLQTGGKRGL